MALQNVPLVLHKRTARALLVLSVAGTFFIGTHADTEPVRRLRVGYVTGGVYEQFVTQRLADLELDQTEIALVPTEGSREQIELLRAGDIDLGLVQSDIAYYAYEGKRGYARFTGFSLVLPLFEEYVQVLVRDDADIYTLGKLLSGVVSVGPRGSGTYQNATDLFTELGFRPGIDFELRHFSLGVGLRELQKGAIDGVFYTSGAFPASAGPEKTNFRALDIPENILEAMAIRSAYYTKTSVLPSSLANKTPINTVAVTALLVASEKTDPRKVAQIVDAVTSKGSQLITSDGLELTLRAPETAIEQAPIPLHEGLKVYLREHGHLGGDFSASLIVVIVCALIGFLVTVQLRMRSYDRMGNLTTTQGTITHRSYQLIAKSGTGLIVLLGFVLLVIAFVESIQYFEDDYARRLNVKNPFADRGFQNTFLWVVTFMGAGDPGDVFPNSPVGKFLASALPFLGLGAVFGFGYSALEQRRERRAKEREGTLVRSIRDHVLICGWNEKAPGIIYTLTSSDVPRKRHVVVIAEMDEPAPLDRYGFDLRYVSYCKGDSADHKVLERANASHADIAVVLGGVKKRKGQNIKSVLSVLALKELARKNSERRNDIMLVAELMFSENRPLFQACGADAIVSSETLTDRVAAMSCVSPLTVDFILDMLTYDDRSELYALPFKNIVNYLSRNQSAGATPQSYTLKSTAEQLLPLGINVVAANNTNFADPPFLDHIFTGEKFSLLIDADDPDVNDDHDLLVIADDFSEIPKAVKKRKRAKPESNWQPEALELPAALERRIILVGDRDRCLRISAELSGYSPAEVTIFTQSGPEDSAQGIIVGDFIDETKWREAGIAQADQITILARSHRDVYSNLNDDPNELDAKALLIAKFANIYAMRARADSRSRKVLIAAEMLSAANQELFENAGVEILIPSDRLLERVITKLVYSRGVASRFLMALLRFDDNKHFMTFELRDPPEGKSFTDLVRMMPDYFQLLGVLPASTNGREQWLNHVGDFRYHFLTTPSQSNASEYKAKTGDVLVGIVDQARWLSSGEV